MARNRYDVGQRFGKIELIGVDPVAGRYSFLCDCGMTFSRSCKQIHAHMPPRECEDCRKKLNGFTNTGNSTNGASVNHMIRPNTDKEEQMIKDFENGNA